VIFVSKHILRFRGTNLHCFVLVYVRGTILSHLSDQQACCGAHPASFSVSTRVFTGVKWPGREVNHSPPSSADLNYEWSYASSPHM